MERASEDSLCEACRVRATQKVKLVGLASGLSLSPAVVSAALGECKPEEDTVQTLRSNALEKMDQYL